MRKEKAIIMWAAWWLLLPLQSFRGGQREASTVQTWPRVLLLILSSPSHGLFFYTTETLWGEYRGTRLWSWLELTSSHEAQVHLEQRDFRRAVRVCKQEYRAPSFTWTSDTPHNFQCKYVLSVACILLRIYHVYLHYKNDSLVTWNSHVTWCPVFYLANSFLRSTESPRPQTWKSAVPKSGLCGMYPIWERSAKPRGRQRWLSCVTRMKKRDSSNLKASML